MSRGFESYIGSFCRRTKSYTGSSIDFLLTNVPSRKEIIDRLHLAESEHAQEDLKAFSQPDGGSSHRKRSGDGKSSTSIGDETPSRERKLGIVYARVSTNKQAEAGRSLDDQVEYLRQVAEGRGIELICEPIRDEGESGQNFDRRGIQKVFQYATNSPLSYLLVDDVNRLGRSTPETLYYIYVLQVECDVTIITHSSELDITETEGLIEATMKSLNSHLSTKQRSRSALRSRLRGFTNERNWNSWFRHVPLGYSLQEDGWLVTDPSEIDIVHEMFNRFVESESYAKTARHLNSTFDEEIDGTISANLVGQNIERPVYIGKPEANIDASCLSDVETSVHDPNLQIVGERKFDEAQAIKDRISTTYSTDSDTLDVEAAVDIFGLFPVLESSPNVKIVCPSCGGEVRCNGQRNLDGSIRAHNYECKACGRQRQWPYLSELENMRELSGEDANEDSTDRDSEEGDE